MMKKNICNFVYIYAKLNYDFKTRNKTTMSVQKRKILKEIKNRKKGTTSGTYIIFYFTPFCS